MRTVPLALTLAEIGAAKMTALQREEPVDANGRIAVSAIKPTFSTAAIAAMSVSRAGNS